MLQMHHIITLSRYDFTVVGMVNWSHGANTAIPLGVSFRYTARLHSAHVLTNKKISAGEVLDGQIIPRNENPQQLP